MLKEVNLAEVLNRAYDRLMEMVKTDPQLGKLIPDNAVSAAIQKPGISHQQIIATVLAGYGNREAFGVRDYETRLDERTGRHVRHYLPRFRMRTYGELATQIEAVANCWREHPEHRVAPGEFVSFISFSGAEMAVVDLACVYAQAIAVPVQANLPAPDMLQILSDVAPAVLVASVDNLDLAVGYALQQETIRSLIVIDVDLADDDERDAVASARARLASADRRVALATFQDIVAFGKVLPWTALPRSPEGPDALGMLMYTSGSTGTPKGAIIHEAMLTQFWNSMARFQPTITVAYAPMNHFMGRNMVFSTMAAGGTVTFTLKSDMSTLLEDFRLTRPTILSFIPRVTEIIYQHYQSEVQRLTAEGHDPAAADKEVRAEMGKTYLGDRLVIGGTGSSPTSPEVQEFLAECFDIAFFEGYGSTEASGAATTFGNRIMRNVILDYKLRDVPELGYYTTDKPYPRGELLLKTKLMIKGYYKRPEASAAIYDPDGWLITGDIMEERGPDHIVWLDRRNNVIKLSQAEYVAIGPLEATYQGGGALVSQIFVYGSSYRPYLLAVVVPDVGIAQARLGHPPSTEELRTMVLAELAETARAASLKSFEVPRDVLIDLEPFSLENGLLSSVRKPLRPKLKQRYGERLEAMYLEMDRQKQDELAILRNDSSGLSVLERVAGALKANLGLATVDPSSKQSYSDLGGDSLGAVALGLLLEEIFGVSVPVSMLLHPAASAGWLAGFVETALASDGVQATPSFAKVHGPDAVLARASDLKLDVFLGPEMIQEAARAAPAREKRVVLLTGANGFLGRFLCLEWLERLAPIGGKLICIIRGADEAAARKRLDEAFGTADPALAARFRSLADKHLEMVAGDLAAPLLGLGSAAFARLAAEVDQIVHPAALVNHMLSYQNLFEPNVVGTAELIRLALTGHQKPFDYVSSLAVPHLNPAMAHDSEDMDVRVGGPEIALSDNYANGYGISKWAGEVLLREANEVFGLPVNVFRCDMILPHARFVGQINVSDMFTRMLFSLVKSGIAPGSFYEPQADGSRAHAHYDGLPVDFTAATIQQVGARLKDGFHTYNITNVHVDDGISLDSVVDWIISAGYSVKRVDDYADWLNRLKDKLRNLPDEERQHSSLTILGNFAVPSPAHAEGSVARNFVAAVRDIPAGPNVPHLSEAYIHKYLADMRALGLLGAATELVG